MVWIPVLVAQVTLWGSQVYPGGAWGSFWVDLTGDGVVDGIVGYVDTATYDLDSILVYDGLSLQVLGRYTPDAGFVDASLYPVSGGGGRVVLLQRNYTTGELQFKVYENFTSLVFTSPVYAPDRYGFLGVYDANGDGTLDIVLNLVYTDRVEVLVYTTPWTQVQEVSPTPGPSVFQVDLRAGEFLQLPLLPHAPGVLELRDAVGRTVRKEIRVGEATLRLHVPPGVYTYRFHTGSVTMTGKLWKVR